MSTNKDQESLSFWSSILQALGDSSSDLDDPYNPEVSSPLLVMPTPMAIDVPPQSYNVPGDGEKENEPGKGETKDGDKSKGKQLVECKETTWHGTRPRNYKRNILAKKRRNDIRKNLLKLKQMTRCKKKDIASTLDCIINHIREMKFFVESQSVGPMLPLETGMDSPRPWVPFNPQNFIMPFEGFTQGESSGSDHQLAPDTTEGSNNQPKSA